MTSNFNLTARLSVQDWNSKSPEEKNRNHLFMKLGKPKLTIAFQHPLPVIIPPISLFVIHYSVVGEQGKYKAQISKDL
jgi:hypothetical protein